MISPILTVALRQVSLRPRLAGNIRKWTYAKGCQVADALAGVNLTVMSVRHGRHIFARTQRALAFVSSPAAILTSVSSVTLNSPRSIAPK